MITQNINQMLCKKSICMLFLLALSFPASRAVAQEIYNPGQVIDSLEQEISGTWVKENNPNNKVEFKTNGVVNFYWNSNITKTKNYEISTACHGENPNNNTYLLKIYSNSGDVSCAYIENLNYNGNDRLVLMTKNQGKIIVYVRPD